MEAIWLFRYARQRARTRIRIFIGYSAAFLNGTAATVYWLLGIGTVLSFVARLGNNLTNFLTAPMGIKPDAPSNDFGDMFWWLLVSTLFTRMLLAGTRRIHRDWPVGKPDIGVPPAPGVGTPAV